MIIEESEAADRLEELIERAEMGEAIYIARNGKVIIQILPARNQSKKRTDK